MIGWLREQWRRWTCYTTDVFLMCVSAVLLLLILTVVYMDSMLMTRSPKNITSSSAINTLVINPDIPHSMLMTRSPKSITSSSANNTLVINPDVPHKLLILMWTPFYGDTTWQKNIGKRHWQRSTNYTCEFTQDRTALSKASYVIFHSYSFRDNILPPYRTANHRWVFYNLEPPTYLIADGPLSWFKPWWLNVIFNFTSSYSSDDDMPQPYGKCEKRLGGMGDDDSHVDDIMRHKMKMVAWFVSNCKTFSVRENYVEQLKRFNISVSVYGACGDRVTCPRSEHCENDIHRTHKFYLAFENSLCQDYVTEKAFRPMLQSYSAVPIVMGLADYASILPPHSYIDVRWFPSAQSLARYLMYLDSNVTEYSKYFAWRRHYKCGYYSLNFDAWCDEGLRLYGVASEESSRFKQWRQAGACVTPEVYFRNVIPAPHGIHIPSFT